MDLAGMQLSLLLGYGNLCSTAAPRTLAGGKRDKSPPREGTASWDPPSQRAPNPSEGFQEVLCTWVLHTKTLHCTMQLFA